ncbi:probable serine/threonine-protein kinase kinX isoform X4 [Scaptodrosophila lebanonensis]|uniref:Probable serine/threonine-protein kinase kinX isoform X4 n=1 Tax=Drosophila lebanonensis TaxID=7225 RepID=A0A6J2TWZ6_DROLE|nr:probable serine/threonine-protein kinase kinX isoform X4 [Scaptodrosophila lebanonensis]
MESNAEVVTKVNEAESENKPTQAEENQKAVNSSAETNESVGAADENKKEQESKEEVKEEPKETVKEEVKKEVKTEEDENGQTETTTVTIVAKKSDGEGSQSETTTTTTTTVTVVAKKPGDDADADVTDSSANTVETKTETTIVTKSEKSAEAGAATEPTVPDTSVEEVEETVVVEEEEEEAEAEAEEVESTSNQKAVAEPEQAETESEAESESESEEEVEEQPPQAAEQKEAEVPEKVQEEDTEEKPQTKKDFNDQIQDIISDIDSNIKAQEKITQLKEQELQLIQKQQELANQIQQQQILAQKLIAQNQLKEQELQAQQRVQQQLQNQQYQQHQQVYQKPAQPYANVINQQEDYNNVKESTNVSRTVDLRKIFTPATDAPEILPKNHYQQYQPKPPTSPSIVPAYSDAGKHRVQLNIHQDQLIEKYSKPGVQVVKSPWEAALQTGSASSAFVEESKFPSQTPPAASPSYFNRDYVDLPVAPAPAPAPTTYGSQQDSYKNTYDTSAVTQRSQPLQPVNPQRELAYKPSVAQGWRGPQVELPREYREYYETLALQQANKYNNFGSIDYDRDRDIYYSQNSDIDYELYKESPDISFTVDVRNRLEQLEEFQQHFLQQQSRERELQKQRDLARYLRSQKEAEEKLKLNIKRCEIAREKAREIAAASSTEPKVSGDGNEETSEQVNVRELISSFEQQSLKQYEEALQTASRLSILKERSKNAELKMQDAFALENMSNRSIDVQGLYVPKEISLASYAPPPVQSPPQVQSPYARAQSPYVPPSNNVGNGYGRPSSYAPSSYEPAGQPSYEPVGQSPYGSGGQSAYGPGGQSAYGPGGQSSGFPLSKPSTGFSSAVPPKQQLYAPSSYQKVPQTSSQNAPPVNFNPSPLSFDKLSKFEQPEQRNVGYQPQRNLNVRGYSKVRNVSPAPFGGARSPIGQGSPISVSPQPHAQQYGGGGYGGYGQSARTASPGQSFNNCARGWGGGSGNAGQRSFLSQRPAVAADSLPYSDF